MLHALNLCITEQDICILPPVTGDCDDYRVRWYYDSAAKRYL